MEILKFGDNPSPNRSNNNQRKPAAMIVAGVLVAMMGMSTTLAGTITISTNNRVEFGQGVVNTAACDDAITVTPSATFVNSGQALSIDTFSVTTLKFSGIKGGATEAEDNCMGKYLTIRAYAGSSNTPMNIQADTGTSTNYFKFRIPTTAGTSSGANSTGGWSVYSGATSNTFTDTDGWTGSDQGMIEIKGFKIANTVTRFTIESSDS